MKNLILITLAVVLVSCETKKPEAPPEDRSIGFLTAIPDAKWHLGTEAAIQTVKDFDKVWSARDYAAMKTFMVDTSRFTFADGTVANTPDEFLAILQADPSTVSWTFDIAYSVDLDPAQGGEHVQAGFTGTSTMDGVETKKHYMESYYIIQGKIIWWDQYTQDIKAEE